jgi:maltose alpha-D-glucosyltransferase/alpha-amylase
MKLHLLAKAFYEIAYEADNRPDWIGTPVRGVLATLDEKEE